MSNLLLKFEAIESRIASYSCPRGTAGRAHALRLRRCFRSRSRWQQSGALGRHQFIQEREPRVESYSIEAAVKKGTVLDGYGAPLEPSLCDQPSKLLSQRDVWPGANQTKYIDRKPSAEARQATRVREHVLRGGCFTLPEIGGQDSIPINFPDGVDIKCSPNKNALDQALLTGNPHAVLEALIKVVHSDGVSYSSKVLRSISRTAFSEILRCLDPEHFVGRFKDLYREISPHDAMVLGIPSADGSGYHGFCAAFLYQIQAVAEARRRHHPLSLLDYKYLLKCARAVGNVKVAEAIWTGMISGNSNPFVPDVECYNHYLATRCWTEAASPGQTHRLRVIPSNLNPRAWVLPPYSLRGHQIGPNRGIKSQVSRIFRQMVEAGVAGNEETFCLMMIGLAREGDMVGVASILNRVWGIDVNALLTMDESELPLAKSYSLDSPFYPSKQLLHTLSHAYGINNEIPAALRIVDYISRQYNITIHTSVWNELLQWTFVLSIKRRGERLRDGTSIGQLPPDAVSNLWATMTSAPYNVKPTMEMYNRLISNLLSRQRYGEAKVRMEEGRNLHRLSVLDLSHKQMIFKATSRDGSPATEKHARDLEFTRLRVGRNRQYIRRWVRLLIWQGSKNLKYHADWTSHDLPALMLKWKSYLPKRVEFQISGGQVKFWTDSVKDNARRQIKYGFGNSKARRRRFRRVRGKRFSMRRQNDVKGEYQ